MRLGDAQVAPSIPVEDLERAQRFYTETLGQRVAMGAPFGVVLAAGAGTQVLLYPRGPVVHEHTLAGWIVDDLDATMRELGALGVEFDDVDIPGFQQGGKVATLGSVRSAWFKDTEGNILSVGEVVS